MATEVTEPVKILKASVHRDARGSHSKFFGNSPENIRVDGFRVTEVFMTSNNVNTIRGLHFQVNPPQPKIVTCLTGSAVVNVVCLDPASPDFGTALRVVLGGGGENSDSMVVVPENHALGYRSLEDDTRMLYIAGADFNADGDIGIDPFDPTLSLDWKISPEDEFTKEFAILSVRDQNLPSFKDFFSQGDK